MLDELVKQALRRHRSRRAGALPQCRRPARRRAPRVRRRATRGEAARRRGRAVAIRGVRARAGRPSSSPTAPRRPRRAAGLLAAVPAICWRWSCSMTNTPAKQSLLGEWLGAGERRAAPRPAPSAARRCSSTARRTARSARPIADAADARGAWLMTLNPRWQFAAGAASRPTRERSGRRARPSSGRPRSAGCASPTRPARQLIESTWKQDGADERRSSSRRCGCRCRRTTSRSSKPRSTTAASRCAPPPPTCSRVCRSRRS